MKSRDRSHRLAYDIGSIAVGIAMVGALFSSCSETPSSSLKGDDRIEEKAPSSPEDVEARATDMAVTLHWTNPTHAMFSHVLISWFTEVAGASAGFPAAPHSVSGAGGERVSKSIGDLTNGALYHFMISAVSASGARSEAIAVSAIPQDGTPPGSVSDIFIIPGDEQIDLEWVNPLDADFHYVEIEVSSSDGEGQVVRVKDSHGAPGRQHSQSIGGLINGVEYTVTIIAFDRSGLSSRVVERVMPNNADPLGVSEIAIFRETDIEGVIILTWTNPKERDLIEVVVSWGANGSDGHVMGTADGERYVILGLTPGVRYSITLTAVYNSGAMVSSQVIRATASDLPPAGVSEVSVVAGEGEGEVRVSWLNPDVVDFDHVEIGWIPSGAGHGNQPVEVGGLAGVLGSRTIVGLTPGREYRFRLIAVDSGGARSAVVEGIGRASDLPPAGVGSVSATVGEGEITVNWTNPEVVDFDHVEIGWIPSGMGHGNQPVEVGGLAGAPGLHTITGLTSGTEYTITLIAVDSGGARSVGVMVSAATPVVDPEATLSITDDTVTEEAAPDTEGRVADFTLQLTNLPTDGVDDVSVFYTVSGFAGDIGSDALRVSRLFVFATTTGVNRGVSPTIGEMSGAGRLALNQPEIDGDIDAEGSATVVFQLMLQNDDGNVVNETITLTIDCVARSRTGTGEQGCASAGTGAILVDSDAVGGSVPARITVTDDEWAALPGNVWQSRHSGTDQLLWEVVWTGSQLVAVGNRYTSELQSMILTSATGTTWTTQTSGVRQDFFGVAWTGSQLVAGGSAGTIVTSSDGIGWTPQDSGTDQSFWGVVWADSQAVAVGNSGTILTSGDGVTWVPQVSGTGEDLVSVVWTGSQVVVVGNAGTVLTSNDGIGWTSQASGTDHNLLGVEWTGSQLVAVGASGTILTSSDGATWMSRVSGTNQFLWDVAWTGSRIVAVGGGGTILISSDGSSWSSRRSGTSNSLYGIVWTGSQVVVLGNSGTILTSP